MRGIAWGALLFLVASGLSLTFGVLRLLKFAHESLYMLGAFLSYSVRKFLMIPTFWFYIADILVALIMAIVGLIIEFGLLRRLHVRDGLNSC